VGRTLLERKLVAHLVRRGESDPRAVHQRTLEFVRLARMVVPSATTLARKQKRGDWVDQPRKKVESEET
jgi:hypothetical protein